MNLAQHLARAARVHPDRPALALGRQVVATWGQMAGRVARLAGALRGRFNLAPGERVALVMRNTPLYAETLYACWHAGLAALPINAKLHMRELAYIFDHSAARLLLATPDLVEAVAGARADAQSTAPILDVGSREFAGLFDHEAMARADTAPDDLAWLFYTSGTTGRPKGAMLTHRNLVAMATSYFIDVDPPQEGGALLHAAPMSHGSGLYMIPHVAIASTQVIPESGHFDPAEIFDLVGAWPHVSMFAAPTMVKRLVEHETAANAISDNLRAIIYGGAPMYLADLKAAVRRLGFKLAQLYGQGESPMTITAMSRAMLKEAYERGDDARLASAGVPQTVVEVRVVDGEDRDVPAGAVGEIVARGDSVMRGYWRNAQATAETLRGGWLHTGDMGAFDDRGFLTLKDRSKDLIISGGSNIYPREVEEVLLGHHGVAEVSVIGTPDPEWGEKVVAFVVLRDKGAASAEALELLCLDNIARFKRPKEYHFVDHLPKNNYGKILKTELRKWIEESPATGPGRDRTADFDAKSE